MMRSVFFTFMRVIRINLTCSGQPKAFEMPVLAFFTEILHPVLEFLLKMEAKGRHIPE